MEVSWKVGFSLRLPKVGPSFRITFCETKTEVKDNVSLHEKKVQIPLLLSPRNKMELNPMPIHSSVYFWN